MFEIIENKLFRRETNETLIEVSCESIESEIKGIESIIESLNENKISLEKELEILKGLEKKLK